MGVDVVFIAKTNLNSDGRILNQLELLKASFPNKKIDFILLPDKPLKIDLGNMIRLHVLKTGIRNSRLLRLFTVLEFTVRALVLLLRLKPKIVHAHDTAVVLPAYFYRILKGKSFKLIYDDHEMPNEVESLEYKIFHYFERKLMHLADTIIFANSERKSLIEAAEKLPSSRTTYFLNLPYFVSSTYESKNAKRYNMPKIDQLISLKREGCKLVMHQGILDKERGKAQLASFSHLITDRMKIMLVGASEASFLQFVDEYELNKSKFVCVGIVDYDKLNDYWKLADASIILYLPTLINNRYCAPNRLYISFYHRIPIIVNESNPVLNNFVTKNGCGLFLEDLNKYNLDSIFEIKYSASNIDELKSAEKQKFLNVYEGFFQQSS